MNTITKQVRARIEQDKAFAARVLGMSVVPNEETAKAVSKGLQALRKMSGEDLEKLNSLTPSEIAKGWEDSNVKVMAKTLEYSLGILTDALGGDQIRNPLFKSMEHLQNPAANVQVVSNMMAGPESTGIDLGWRRAYNFLSPTNAKEVEVMNWRAGLRFLEYEYRTDKPEATTLGGRTNQRESARFFASAFKHAEGDFDFSVVTLNQLLSYMRAEALTMQSNLAYRMIFAKKIGGTSVVNNAFMYSDTGENKFTDWSTSSTDRKTIEERLVFQVRHVLNESRRLMIDHATQVQNLKKRENFREAPISVTAADTILFYYNHAHRELIDKVFQDLRGEEGVSPTVLSNLAFIETTAAPVGGGYDITRKDGQRDDWGFRETITESTKDRGGMMIIPGNLNYFLTFRNLTFLNDSDVMSEMNTIGAKFEANAILDKRQKAHITFAASE